MERDIQMEMVGVERRKEVGLRKEMGSDWGRVRKDMGMEFMGEWYGMCGGVVDKERNSR